MAGTHLGIRQKLTIRITAFDRPFHFRDTQVQGAFKRFDHDHYFKDIAGATLMRDVFNYDAPLGILGRLADTLFLKTYMRSFFAAENRVIKNVAEAHQSAPDEHD